jgi:hypothetical protein
MSSISFSVIKILDIDASKITMLSCLYKSSEKCLKLALKYFVLYRLMMIFLISLEIELIDFLFLLPCIKNYFPYFSYMMINLLIILLVQFNLRATLSLLNQI